MYVGEPCACRSSWRPAKELPDGAPDPRAASTVSCWASFQPFSNLLLQTEVSKSSTLSEPMNPVRLCKVSIWQCFMEPWFEVLLLAFLNSLLYYLHFIFSKFNIGFWLSLFSDSILWLFFRVLQNASQCLHFPSFLYPVTPWFVRGLDEKCWRQFSKLYSEPVRQPRTASDHMGLFGATSQSPFNAGMSGLWKGILWPNEQIHVLMQSVDLSICSITSLLTNEQLCGLKCLIWFSWNVCNDSLFLFSTYQFISFSQN